VVIEALSATVDVADGTVVVVAAGTVVEVGVLVFSVAVDVGVRAAVSSETTICT
jgi:hypothetical protein